MLPLFTLLLLLLQSFVAEGREPETFAVVSDFHLRFSQEAERIESISRAEDVVQTDEHWRAFEGMMRYLESRADIEHVIINGDLFDGLSTIKLDMDDRALLIRSFLLYMKKRLGKTLHFNIGNHDEAWDFSTLPPVYSPSFTNVLVPVLESLSDQGIHLIGDNSQVMFPYSIGEVNFEISHVPFVKTEELERQLQRMPLIERGGELVEYSAARKVTVQPYLSEEQQNDGVIRLFGDNHTPLSDSVMRVHDSGKLTSDRFLPLEPPSFLIVNSLGAGMLMEVKLEAIEAVPLLPGQLACRYAMALSKK
ncbi:MAG: metallophosphoesterase [Pseudomonadota bacterium]